LVACWLDPHCESIVVAGVVRGSPAASHAVRVMLKLCSPTWLTQPPTTCPMAPGSMPVRSMIACWTTPSSSAGWTLERPPPRRPIGAGEDRVAVVLGGRREPRVEVVADLGRVADRDRRGQQRVEAAADPVERDRALGAKARDLAARVDAGVGARRAGDRDLVSQQPGERGLELALHRRAVVLALPAAQRGAVVLDDEPDVPHAPVVHDRRAQKRTAGVRDTRRPTRTLAASCASRSMITSNVHVERHMRSGPGRVVRAPMTS